MARGNNKLKNIIGKILSFPSVTISRTKGSMADNKRKAVRLARETKGVAASPGTKRGREIISARNTTADIKKKLKKKRK